MSSEHHRPHRFSPYRQVTVAPHRLIDKEFWNKPITFKCTEPDVALAEMRVMRCRSRYKRQMKLQEERDELVIKAIAVFLQNLTSRGFDWPPPGVITNTFALYRDSIQCAAWVDSWPPENKRGWDDSLEHPKKGPILLLPPIVGSDWPEWRQHRASACRRRT